MCDQTLYLCGKLFVMGKFNEIVKSEIPTLVDFYATWCGPCQMMHPVLDLLKGEMGEQVRILKIDVDNNPDVADKFKIRGVPTFILFKGGEILWRQSGGMDINTLKAKIKQAI
jgi:thioredoxin 1